MKELALKLNNLSKIYTLDDKFKQTFRERITTSNYKSKKVQALKDINLSIFKGDVLGIIGENGSGKSTLLKILSGITKPSSGNAEIYGSVASILEVGTGFNPELSGRENIYFSSTVLGMSRKEAQKVENDIIQFSELKDFIDLQVKYYSSGMFMRLAFSVIAHIKADILLLDEVFSVGDSNFRKKCETKIESLTKSGRTILLVSHDIGSIMKICKSFVWLSNGSIIDSGNKLSTVTDYLTNNKKNTANKEQSKKNPTKEIELNEENEAGIVEENLKLHKEEALLPYTLNNSEINNLDHKHLGPDIKVRTLRKNQATNTFSIDDDIILECIYTKKTEVPVIPVFCISYLLGTFSLICNPRYNTEDIDVPRITNCKGKIVATCKIPNNLLNNGLFGVSVFFMDKELNEHLFIENITTFTIAYKAIHKSLYGDDGKAIAPLKPKYNWNFQIAENNE